MSEVLDTSGVDGYAARRVALTARRRETEEALRTTLATTALAVSRNAEARRRLRASIEALQRDRETREVRSAPQPVGEVELLRDATQRLTRLVEGLGGPPPAAAPPVVAPLLTRRQLEVLGLLGEGHGTAEIARRLWLSRCTVRNHVTAILGALDVHSRLEAVARARALQLL